MSPAQAIYQDADIAIFTTESLWYGEYPDRYFVIEKSNGYGYFHHTVKHYSKGELFDKFGIVLIKQE